MSRLRVVMSGILLVGVGVMPMLGRETADADAQARTFIAEHLARVRPLEIQANLAWWQANISGNDADFAAKEAAQNRLDALLAQPATFAQLQAIRSARPRDPLLARQIDLLFLQYQEKQVDPQLLQQMTAKANAVEKAFNVFRARVDGREMSDSAVRQVLKESKDSNHRRQVWEASKQVGAVVEADLKALVRLRNQAARQLGYGDFHQMMLRLAEQEQAAVLKLFDELDELTREPFRQAKAEIDAALARQYQLAPAALMPWHYHDPFFQEPPTLDAQGLDAAYAKVDIVKLCREFYAGIGLPIDDVLARSDLFEKPGKSPHAFCTDMDREGDVRVLANIVPNEYWAATMLHELGHAVYSSKYIPAELPYVLRGEAHILTTEGVAMQFEKFSKSAAFLQAMGLPVADPASFDATAQKMLRHQLLIFSRWCQVMLRFEAGLYANPEQDLNQLWWDLVERYQLLRRPPGRQAPDYGSKIHICSAPAYYHNYMLGQLFASQVHHALCREVLHADPAQANYVGRKEVGEWMKRKVFAPGRSLSWNALTHFATGADLNARAFAADFGGR